MFYHKTPRDYIEGYTDPLVVSLAQLPVYKAGDATTDPYLAINLDPLTPKGNDVALFSGTDDYLMTR